MGLNWERQGGKEEQEREWERGRTSAPAKQKHMVEENPLQEPFRKSSELNVIKDH